VSEERSCFARVAVARSTGSQDAFEPTYEELPTTFHSIESERYRAGEILRALPVGRCIVRTEGKTYCVTVPAPRRKS
jgi:hypothetical protein